MGTWIWGSVCKITVFLSSDFTKRFAPGGGGCEPGCFPSPQPGTLPSLRADNKASRCSSSLCRSGRALLPGVHFAPPIPAGRSGAGRSGRVAAAGGDVRSHGLLARGRPAAAGLRLSRPAGPAAAARVAAGGALPALLQQGPAVLRPRAAVPQARPAGNRRSVGRSAAPRGVGCGSLGTGWGLGRAVGWWWPLVLLLDARMTKVSLLVNIAAARMEGGESGLRFHRSAVRARVGGFWRFFSQLCEVALRALLCSALLR